MRIAHTVICIPRTAEYFLPVYNDVDTAKDVTVTLVTVTVALVTATAIGQGT